MPCTWKSFCVLSVTLLVHIACDGEHSKRVPVSPTETTVPTAPSESRDTTNSQNSQPAPEPVQPVATVEVNPETGVIVAEKEVETPNPVAPEEAAPTPETTPTPTPIPTEGPAAPETPAPPAVEIITEDLGRAIAEAEAYQKFQEEFSSKREAWVLELRKGMALLHGSFYQTVKTYRRPELMKRRDELTTFVNSSAVNEKTKENARAMINSNYDEFEVFYTSRGSAAKEFSNLVNTELKRLVKMCTSDAETGLSCDVIQKLAASKPSNFFLKVIKWPEASYLTYETLIVDLGAAPLNDEQLAIAEKFREALQASEASE